MLSIILGTQLATAHMNNGVIPAKVNIWPRVLCIQNYSCNNDFSGNSKSSSECESLLECDGWITAFVRLPRKYDVRDIDPSTVTLQVMEGSVPLSRYRIFWRTIFIAKFDRDAVIDLLCPMLGHMTPHVKQKVSLVVTGNLFDGQSFRGEDTILVFLGD
jgi:hypothetical protein